MEFQSLVTLRRTEVAIIPIIVKQHLLLRFGVDRGYASCETHDR